MPPIPELEVWTVPPKIESSIQEIEALLPTATEKQIQDVLKVLIGIPVTAQSFQQILEERRLAQLSSKKPA